MKIVLVHVVDSIQFEPETAQLAQVITEEGGSPRLLLADYGTADERFLAAFVDPPALALFRVTRQTLPLVEHTVRSLREHRPDLPLGFYGPLVTTDSELASAILNDAWLFPGESEGPLRALAREDEVKIPAGSRRVRPGGIDEGGPATPLAADAFPNPHYGLFGGGALFRRGIGVSFFGETWRLPLELSVGGETLPPANAALASFHRHLPRPLELRSPALVRDRLDHAFNDFEHLRGVEIRDRALLRDRAAGLALLEVVGEGGRGFDLRVDETLVDAELLRDLKGLGARRIVLELDAPPGAPTPEGFRDPEHVGAAARRAHEAGLEVGVLASFGVPDESTASMKAKRDFIRDELAPQRLRSLPFEPRFGHPAFRRCEEEGLIPSGKNAWNREVYRPLVQPSLPAEEWYLAWQGILDLQAEIEDQHRRAGASA